MLPFLTKFLCRKDFKPRIHIVTEGEPGWILRRLSLNFARETGATVGLEADNGADVNFYVNYALFRNKTSCDIGFFTHRERESPLRDDFDRIATSVDWCVAMCKITAGYLPPHKTSLLKIAPDEIFTRDEIVIGVVGREYTSGRKRFCLLEELKKIRGVRIETTEGRYQLSDMPGFYRSIDYLLVLSENEGGPVPVLEALAMGKPVIAPDVGFCWDYPVLRYTSFEELKDLLARLVMPKDSWKTAGKELLEICNLAVNSASGMKRPGA